VNRNPRSLLDFAIAAPLAIVPTLMGVLLLVALVRPADRTDRSDEAWRDGAERYLSVRHLAALKTFEAAIVERSGTSAALPTPAQLLDALPACRRAWGRVSAMDWVAGAAAQSAPAQRIAAQLVALDAALERFSARANRRVAQPVAFDAGLWYRAAAQSLATPLASTDYPGARFELRCGDLEQALATLLRADARLLDSLTWRGSAGGVLLARWRPDQVVEIAPHQLMRRNPWGGVAGCIFLGRNEAGAPSHFVADARSVLHRVCTQPLASGHATGGEPRSLAGEPGPADPFDDSRWSVPPSLGALLVPLEPLRRPSGALLRVHAQAASAPRQIELDGSAVDTGLSVVLTIDPALQALAQRTAACYTGRHDICRALGLARRDDASLPIGHALLEGAMVRMAAVAVIDVASGRIEALAGARSRCARQEVDGPGRDADCDARLPYPVRYRPDALLNPAVFEDAMPASTVKPIMAAAYLADPAVGERWLGTERAAIARGGLPPRESLRGQLLRSDSARFLDRMFCLDQREGTPCERPWAMQQAALAFGWDGACGQTGSTDCGRYDLLFGRAWGVHGSDPLATGEPAPLAVAYGRLMSQPRGERPGAPMQLRPRMNLDPAIVRRCAAGADRRRGTDDDWEKCRGGAVVDVVAEGWGQGHARASALGVAGMMATLAAAANGQPTSVRPHLVASLHGPHGDTPPALAATLEQWRSAGPASVGLSSEVAAVILDGLSYSHRIGTARSACEQVFFTDIRCRDIDWLAGKTGTPSFPHDGKTLDELAQLCPRGVAPPEAKPGTCSTLRPYKWYVAAWRAGRDAGAPWAKVIAVLTERNWTTANGQIHGAGDHGPNPAAEIALQIIGRRAALGRGTLP
jgi:hypothetical protein